MVSQKKNDELNIDKMLTKIGNNVFCPSEILMLCLEPLINLTGTIRVRQLYALLLSVNLEFF
jgi:hypothetical protein